MTRFQLPLPSIFRLRLPSGLSISKTFSELYSASVLALCAGGAMLSAAPSMAQTSDAASQKSSWLPEVHGTVRSKYEYEPQISKGRFEVRNARLGVQGKITPAITYRAEVDLCDEGQIKMLDAYTRISPIKGLRFTLGQMRVPFTIDAHRAPHLQYFANRSFIAKQVGNVRDVGAAIGYKFGSTLPLDIEAGIFNGSGLTGQKDFWTDSYNFSAKASAMILPEWNVTLSLQKAHATDADVMMYDAGTYWQQGRWHFEAEYLRKYYRKGTFSPVNAVDAFAVYRLPMKGACEALSFLTRYDYMSDHSKGKLQNDGSFSLDDPERHRITAGITLHLGTAKLPCDLRINYEQYIYGKDVAPKISERNKAVAEIMVHF